MNIDSQAFWFLSPQHWGHVERRATLVRENVDVVSRRPVVDYFGDEIPAMEMHGPIAVVPVSGPLLKGATGSDKKAGFWSYDDIADDIDAAINSGAKGIILNISSPGGTAVGAGELARYIKDVKDSGTEVYSFTDSMQCSAAEYLSGACTARFATADAIVGSIGTIMATVSLQGMLEKFGVKAEVFTSGKFKGAGHPYKDLTPEQSEYLQGFVDTLAGEFKSWMSQHRKGMTQDLMQGQIFTGRQASQNGLIDSTSAGLRQLISALS